MKTYMGMEKYNSFITPITDRASHPSRFIPGERSRGARWEGSLVGLRAGLEEKNF
jgi:hypothetical protein